MANYAELTGCSSRDVAQRYPAAADLAADGPHLVAKYRLPLFWLLAFGECDILSVTDEGQELLVLCAPVHTMVERLERRRASALTLVPGALAPLYDEWIGFLSRHYRSCVLIRTDDLFSMEGYAEAGLQLRATVQSLNDADSGGPLEVIGALDRLAAFGDLFQRRIQGEVPESAAIRWRDSLAGGLGWNSSSEEIAWPPHPSAAEVEFAASVTEAAAPETLEAAEERLALTIRQGVHADTFAGRLAIAVRKLSGRLPIGADAPTVGMRKAIGGGATLLYVVCHAFIGLVVLTLSAGLLYVSAYARFDLYFGVPGVLLAAIGVWFLRVAWRSSHVLRVILKA